jgi:Fur family zinc uptake transcriptional regulator
MWRLEALQGRHVTATSVYRALGFLLYQGLIMRVQSRNGYLPCPNPGTPFDGAIFICDVCGVATSVNDPAVEHLLIKRAESLGFAVQGSMHDLQGV